MIETLTEVPRHPELLRRRYVQLQRVAMFQSFALVLALIGLALAANWRVAVTFYAVALCYLPFFARR